MLTFANYRCAVKVEGGTFVQILVTTNNNAKNDGILCATRVLAKLNSLRANAVDTLRDGIQRNLQHNQWVKHATYLQHAGGTIACSL